HELQQVHVVRAERDTRILREVGGDAEPVCGRDDAGDAGALGDLHRYRVDRLRQGFRQRHVAEIAVGVIVRLPVAYPDRSVDKVVGRAQPGFEPGQIHEWLEGRTWLALRLRRAVELALAIIAAADHG